MWWSEPRQQQAAAFHYISFTTAAPSACLYGPQNSFLCGFAVAYLCVCVCLCASAAHISEAARFYSNSWWQYRGTQITYGFFFPALPTGITICFAQHKHNAIIRGSLWGDQIHFVCNRRKCSGDLTWQLLYKDKHFSLMHCWIFICGMYKYQ